ncbi:MAG: hypothetical protein Q8P34_03980 [Bacteroidota bacterium]|nr:hypothetical protein [Bacteroidota bacterium]
MLLAAGDWLLAKRLRKMVSPLRRIQNSRFKLEDWMRLLLFHLNSGYKIFRTFGAFAAWPIIGKER